MSLFESGRDTEELISYRLRTIPENERCPDCAGAGKKRVDCTFTHAIYNDCFSCNGTGLKTNYEKNKRLREELKKITEKKKGD